MEQPRTDLSAPGQERELRLLRGGLHGRFAQSFCVMQTTLDAMESVLRTQANPVLQQAMQPLLEEMERRLPALERLADQAADLALGSALRELYEPEPIELVGLLRTLCGCVNEELALRGSSALLTLGSGAGTPAQLGLLGSRNLVDALLANLFSNSLHAKRDAHVTLTLTQDRRLLYEDDGPGLPPEAWALLLEGACQGELLHRGGTGLLLVREYADCLGWQPGRQGNALAFRLPPAPQGLTLYDHSARELLYAEQCRSRFARELAALDAERSQ